jgi:Secretion system C-terminal sorting domain
MKNTLHFKLLLIVTFFITLSAQSQPDRFAFAVTDTASGGTNWNFLRQVDLKTGIYSKVLFSFLIDKNEILPGTTANLFNCSGTAAVAYDKKNRRLYYTPMLVDRLSYIDLKTMRNYTVTNNFSGLKQKATDQSNIFTRMAIDDDNDGYALTNDGKHLIRFSTGKNNTVIKDMGSLVDAPGNKEMSVHNGCSSFGGDIIADDAGHLYLVTSRNHVFKIKIATKVATYLGTVSGVPADFTTSGLVIDQDNRLLIVSAVDASDIYILDIKTLAAKGLKAKNPRHTADFANSSILRTKRLLPYIDMTGNPNLSYDSKIQLYPNPVTSGELKIQFTDIEPGTYTVNVIDGKGQIIASQIANVGGKNNLVHVSLSGLTAKGIYIVRVVDKNSKVVFNDKILLQ